MSLVREVGATNGGTARGSLVRGCPLACLIARATSPAARDRFSST